MKKIWLVFALALSSCVSNFESTSLPVSTSNAIDTATPGTALSDYKLSSPQPQWMKDENSNILLLSMGDLALFVDPVTAKSLFLAFPEARWIDNSHVVFLSDNQSSDNSLGGVNTYLFDLTSWEITKTESVLSLDNNDVDGGTPNLRIDKKEKETPLKIYNDQLAQWDVFLYPPHGLYNINAVYTDNRVFILQGKDVYGVGEIITVYDFMTRKILKTFTEKVEMNILRYSKGKIVYVTANVLCAIDVQSLEKECGYSIPDKYDQITVGQVLDYPDFIPFFYQEHVEKYAYTRKLCIVDFFDGEIKCPMENLKALKPVISTTKDWQDPNKSVEIIESKSVWDYSVSPDKKYILFCYGNNYYARYEGTAIVDVDGQSFHLLDDIEYVPVSIIANSCQPVFGHVAFDWRPSP